jgi:hypothetical protein
MTVGVVAGDVDAREPGCPDERGGAGVAIAGLLGSGTDSEQVPDVCSTAKNWIGC